MRVRGMRKLRGRKELSMIGGNLGRSRSGKRRKDIHLLAVNTRQLRVDVGGSSTVIMSEGDRSVLQNLSKTLTGHIAFLLC